MPNSEVKRLNVFLCHAFDDKPRVRELCRRLRADRYDVWFDEDRLMAGQDWKLEIQRGIRNADVIIFCLSTVSVTKEGYVQVEIKEALEFAKEKPEGTIFIIPLRLDDCPVPSSVQKWQWANLFDDLGYKELRKSLNGRKKQLDATLDLIDTAKNKEKKQSFPVRGVGNSKRKWNSFKQTRGKTDDRTIHSRVVKSKEARFGPDVITLENASRISCLQRLDIMAQPRVVCFSPTGNFLAVSINSMTSSTISLYVVQDKYVALERSWNESHLDNYKEVLLGPFSVGEYLKNFGLGSVLEGVWISRSLSFSSDGLTLASTVSTNDKIRIWRVGDTKSTQTISLQHAGVEKVVFSPSGTFLASASHGSIRLWNAENLTLVSSFQAGHTFPNLAFSPDGRLLVSSNTLPPPRIGVWRISGKGAEFVSNLPWPDSDEDLHDSSFPSIAFSPDGQFIAAMHMATDTQLHSVRPRIWLWKVQDAKFAKGFGTGKNSNCIAFSLDGKMIASGLTDGQIELYDVWSGMIVTTLQGHSRWINSICFHPNGKVLASAAEDGTVRLWGISSQN